MLIDLTTRVGLYVHDIQKQLMLLSIMQWSTYIDVCTTKIRE